MNNTLANRWIERNFVHRGWRTYPCQTKVQNPIKWMRKASSSCNQTDHHTHWYCRNCHQRYYGWTEPNVNSRCECLENLEDLEESFMDPEPATPSTPEPEQEVWEINEEWAEEDPYNPFEIEQYHGESSTYEEEEGSEYLTADENFEETNPFHIDYNEGITSYQPEPYYKPIRYEIMPWEKEVSVNRMIIEQPRLQIFIGTEFNWDNLLVNEPWWLE